MRSVQVEIQVEMEELEGDEGLRDNENAFTQDPFDTVVGQEGSDEEDEIDDDGDLSDLSSDAGGDADEESPVEVEQDIAHVREMVAKLDAILKLLFDHFHRTYSSTTIRSSPSPNPPPEDMPSSNSPLRPPTVLKVTPEYGRDLRRSQFITLLSIFDRTILRTFKSRYTQFLLFWYSSLDPEFADMFQGMLVSRALFEDTQPMVTRAAAASYIASFVSRAQFVREDSAKRVVGLLCDFLETHLDMCAAMGEAFDPSAAHHALFYAVAQAVFLIFCFRWRDLQVDDELEMDDLGIDTMSHKKWIPKLDIMQRVVSSSLNPLKVSIECHIFDIIRYLRDCRCVPPMWLNSLLGWHKALASYTVTRSLKAIGDRTRTARIHPHHSSLLLPRHTLSQARSVLYFYEVPQMPT